MADSAGGVPTANRFALTSSLVLSISILFPRKLLSLFSIFCLSILYIAIDFSTLVED